MPIAFSLDRERAMHALIDADLKDTAVSTGRGGDRKSPAAPLVIIYLLAYSPYHNVREGVHYPAVMFVAGDADTRADPMHARKMTALPQCATGAGDRPILLHYRAEAGHMGEPPD